MKLKIALLVIFVIIFIGVKVNMEQLKNIFEETKNPSNHDSDTRIELTINDDEYEMIHTNDIEAIKINVTDHDGYRVFKTIAQKDHDENVAKKINHNDTASSTYLSYDDPLVQFIVYMPHRYMPTVLSRTFDKKAVDDIADYDPDDLYTHVYYDESMEALGNGSTSFGELDQSIISIVNELLSMKRNNLSNHDVFSAGVNTIKCILVQFRKKKRSYKVLAKTLCYTSVIWFTVYLLFAVPLWCIKGWCSCCLCCKFFKPQQTIQAAKDYLRLNPPGVLITKKGVMIQYEPTEREKDCYEEFGHFIRTL